MTEFGALAVAKPKVAEILLGIGIGAAGESQQGCGGDNGLEHAISLDLEPAKTKAHAPKKAPKRDGGHGGPGPVLPNSSWEMGT